MKYKNYKQNELYLLNSLRLNSREKLTTISRRTSIPVTTLFEKLKEYNRTKIIIKNTTLVDYKKIGYNVRSLIMLKINISDLDKAKTYIKTQINVNNFHKINNNYNLFVEYISKDLQAVDSFLDNLEREVNINQRNVHNIIDPILQENFLTQTMF